MNSLMITVIASVGAFLLGFFVRFIYAKIHLASVENKIERLEIKAGTVVEKESQKILLEAEKSAAGIKRRAEDETRKLREEISQERRSLRTESEKVQGENQEILTKSRTLEKQQQRIQRQESDLKREAKQLEVELEKVSQMTAQQAKNLIIDRIEVEARKDAAALVEKIDKEATQAADKKARSILVNVMQRMATQVTGEVSLLTVSLPSDDVKGRIIGKEGRNIRSLETLTGVDIIIDDTPETVVISSFDPIRRVIAKEVLDRLVVDGRIHPVRIEEVANKVTKEIGQKIYEAGEQVLLDLGILNVHDDMVKALGRLQYRTSYGQNVLEHSKEVAVLAGMLCAEVGGDRELVRRGALFHDVGKGMASDGDSSHIELGAALARRIGEREEVVNAIEAHHGDVPFGCLESVIVQMADAISASRPGARRENVESYIKRLENLEAIAKEYEGVEKAFALQAGRELRILVDTDLVDDAEAQEIAKNVAEKIEGTLKYPGRIRITIIRESRFVEYAH